MKVYAYHGGNRSQDVDFLASCDVVGQQGVMLYIYCGYCDVNFAAILRLL